MRILVTGGSGFLGRELVSRATAAGHEVAATYLAGTVGAQVTWHRVDVRVPGDVRDCLASEALPTATRAGSGPSGPLQVVLDCTDTRRHLRTRLRGAREFLRRPEMIA